MRQFGVLYFWKSNGGGRMAVNRFHVLGPFDTAEAAREYRDKLETAFKRVGLIDHQISSVEYAEMIGEWNFWNPKIYPVEPEQVDRLLSRVVA